MNPLDSRAGNIPQFGLTATVRKDPTHSGSATCLGWLKPAESGHINPIVLRIQSTRFGGEQHLQGKNSRIGRAGAVGFENEIAQHNLPAGV